MVTSKINFATILSHHTNTHTQTHRPNIFLRGYKQTMLPVQIKDKVFTIFKLILKIWVLFYLYCAVTHDLFMCRVPSEFRLSLINGIVEKQLHRCGGTGSYKKIRSVFALKRL